MPSTETWQSVVDVVQTAKGMKPLRGVGGIPNEPALSISKDTLQRLLSAPYNWRFNKQSIPPFTTIAYQQDYLISGCTITCANRYILHVNALTSPNGPGLTQFNNTVSAVFNDFAPNGFPAGGGPNPGDIITIAGAANSNYNVVSQIVSVLSPTSFTFNVGAAGLSPDGGQGFSNPGINWLEHVSLVDYQSSGTPKPVHDGEIAASLFMESIIQPPFKFANQVEKLYTNSLTNQTMVVPMIRSWPVPSSQVWAVYLFYQGKAPTLTDLGQTWFPFPDDLGYVVRSNFKAMALDWWEDPRAVNALLLADRDIQKALGSKDQEPRSEAMFPDLPILRGG